MGQMRGKHARGKLLWGVGWVRSGQVRLAINALLVKREVGWDS